MIQYSADGGTNKQLQLLDLASVWHEELGRFRRVLSAEAV